MEPIPMPLKRLSLIAAVLLCAQAAHLAGQAPVPQPPADPPRAPGDADQQEITLVLESGERPLLRLAFPEMGGVAALSGGAGEAGATLADTLLADLEETRIFSIQDAGELAEAGVTGQAVGFEIFQSLGNEILLRSELKVEVDRLAFEGRIFDVKSGDQIMGKRYTGTFDLARRIAHSFADEVVRYFTNRPGIALTSLAFYSDRDGFKELYLMDYDGWNQRRVTGHRSTSLSPAWSPAGDAIAYVSYFEGTPAIYLLELASGSKTPVVTDGSFNASPDFSPDGTRIAFTRSVEGNSEIFVADLGGGNLRRLTHSPGIDTNPAWSPTGREIAFTSSRSGEPHVYVMDAEGANVRRLTFEGDYNDGAAWHPDGDRIAFASRRGGRFQIAVTELVTLETRVATAGGNAERPSFSPDGRKITFTSDHSGQPQIYVIDADGTHQRQLTRDGANWAAAWSGYPR
jgi:TolB protein